MAVEALLDPGDQELDLKLRVEEPATLLLCQRGLVSSTVLSVFSISPEWA